MPRTRIFGLLLIALVGLTPLRSVEAQLGSVGKKLKEAVKGKEQVDPKKDAAGKPIFNEDVLEITAPVLDNFIRAMQAEIAGQKELKDLLATIPTPEQYETCQQQPAVVAEMQKILMSLANVPKNTTQEEMQRISQKLQSDMEAMVKKKCGINPSEASSLKAEKQREIESRVLAVGGAGGASNQTQTGPLTAKQYLMLKERAIAFCMSKLAAPGTDFSVERVEAPGIRSGLMWVYTSEEAKRLQARCKEIAEFGKQVM